MQHTILISFLLTLLLNASANAQPAPPSTALPLATVELDEDTLRVHFIDIGAGLAALIETPGGKHILIDGGKSGKAHFKSYVNHFVGDAPIDILIVTHADDDHFFNLVGFIKKFDVHHYWNTGYTSDELEKLTRWPKKFLKKTIPALEAKGMQNWTPLENYVEAGDWETIDDLGTLGRSDDVEVQFLNVDKQPPVTSDESKDRNNASLVFKIEYMGTSFLFTGDINGRKVNDSNQEAITSEEAELVDLANSSEYISLEATVLQVAHHGSDGSSSLPFLREVDPQWAVIPAGKRHHHPDPDAVARLEQVIEDDDQILRTNAGGGSNDPRGDDHFVFVVDASGIHEVLRITSRR